AAAPAAPVGAPGARSGDPLPPLPRVGLDLLLVVQTRPFRDGSDVAGGAPTPHRLTERGPDGAVRLVDGGRLAPVADHPGVQAFEVFWFQAVQPVRTDTRDEVHSDGDLVRVQRVPTQPLRRDVPDPVGQPLLDCPGPAGLADVPVVAGTLKLADLRPPLRL